MIGPAGDRGSVSAELAVAMPAVVAVVVFGVGALTAATEQVRLQDAAADAARLVSRGDDAMAAEVVQSAVDGASSSTEPRGGLVCVTAAAEARVAGLSVPLEAVSCALSGGR